VLIHEVWPEICGFSLGVPIFTGDIVCGEHFGGLKLENENFCPRVRFSMAFDGQDVLFATVTRRKRVLLPDIYQADVQILPSLIPQAMYCIYEYMLTHPQVSEPRRRQTDAVTAEIKGIIKHTRY
jgi:hypothetical protein